MPHFTIREKDDSGRLIAAYSTSTKQTRASGARPEVVTVERNRTDWRRLLSNIFLPAGYPTSVSPDYLQYQIYNALQAFCSSLAGLIASRAVLEGHGVGKADASATRAIFLTVLQDVFSRLTTIASAYYLGTSLYPEAKTYRLLADILNDAAILLDSLSPHLSAISLSLTGSDSSLRVASLCLSGALRALCGVAAGGSKAALTVHFATSGKAKGDIGDLNAKDASKETVLALLGMLCGTFVMHHVHSTSGTYVILFMLMFCHLLANYLAVQAVALCTLNRRRANTVWMIYRSPWPGQENTISKLIADPHGVSLSEPIFYNPSALSGIEGSEDLIGFCDIGSPFTSILSGYPSTWSAFVGLSISKNADSHNGLSASEVHSVLELFTEERYVLWFDSELSNNPCRLRICLKEGHTPYDDLKAWIHAQELALAMYRGSPAGNLTFDERVEAVRTSYRNVEDLFPSFVEAARAVGWRIDEGGLLAGSPKTISIEYAEEDDADGVPVEKEDRKNV
ncbi:hypothetical protein AcV7_001712 [Taiwanofungus camphoratus]|nr:hypothetical protein AcV7_001712 [Antrodia cinnamomea]